MVKIKVLGQRVTVKFTTDPIVVNNQPAYAYADFLENVILIGLMKETDFFNSFLHEYTHFFNRLTMTDINKDIKMNEEDRASYVGLVVSALIRENGPEILTQLNKKFLECMRGTI